MDVVPALYGEGGFFESHKVQPGNFQIGYLIFDNLDNIFLRSALVGVLDGPQAFPFLRGVDGLPEVFQLSINTFRQLGSSQTATPPPSSIQRKTIA